MSTSTARRVLHGVTYRDDQGRVRHVRVLALSEEEAADHARTSVIGFATLERVFRVANDPFAKEYR